MIYSITSLATLTKASRTRVTNYITKNKTVFKKSVRGNRIMYSTSLSESEIIELFPNQKPKNHKSNINKFNESWKSNKL